MGADYYKLIQIGTNYGYAYQIGTYAAVRDAVRKIQMRYGLSPGEVELIWNVSHNSIYKDDEKPENTDIVKELARLWKELSDEDKETWNNKAKEIMEADN